MQRSLDRVVERTGRTREETLAAMIKDNPLGRLIRPEEVAAAVLALCLPEASAMTGETVAVAGGEI
jgi:NAD(P)-dependent dehydrogenase (short-subunit alcohol dehydrogenase family)